MKMGLGLGLGSVRASGGGGGSLEGFTLEGETYPANSSNMFLCPLSDNLFVLADKDTETFSVIQLNGDDTFTELASLDISPDGINIADTIFKVSSTRFCWIDSAVNALYTYEFNGTDTITQIGSAYDYGDTGGYASGTYLADNVCVVWSGAISAADAFQRLTFDGLTWTKTGATVAADGGYHEVIGMSKDRVALVSTATNSVKAYDWNGSSWLQVGSTYATAASSGVLLGDRWDDDTIIIWEGDNLQALAFNGTNFTKQGVRLNINATSGVRSIAKLNDARIVAYDSNGGGIISLIKTINFADTVQTLTDLEADINYGEGSKFYTGTDLRFVYYWGDTTISTTSPTGRRGKFDQTLFNGIGGAYADTASVSYYTVGDFANSAVGFAGIVFSLPASVAADTTFFSFGGSGSGDTTAGLQFTSSGELRYGTLQDDSYQVLDASAGGKDFIIFLNYKSASALDIYVNGSLSATVDPKDSYSTHERLWLFSSSTSTDAVTDLKIARAFYKGSEHGGGDPSIADLYNYLNTKYSLSL